MCVFFFLGCLGITLIEGKVDLMRALLLVLMLMLMLGCVVIRVPPPLFVFVDRILPGLKYSA